MGLYLEAIILIAWATKLIISDRRISFDAAAMIAGGVMALWLSGYTQSQIMQIVYPSWSALALAVFVAICYRHRILKSKNTLLLILLFGLEFFAALILGLAAGEKPILDPAILDFEAMRPYLVSLRHARIVLLLVILNHEVERSATLRNIRDA